ncbi:MULTISPECIES: COG3650 family protein [unclassified Brevundimonas]|uniref:COG3650 family protein n=1 Tax=unclassified Brevundimonas TaxID=2622653 RepID=UPI003F8FADAC
MRFALLLSALSTAAALAACSQPAGKAPIAPKEARALAGVDLDQPLRVLGTEPFWAVDITPQGLTYSGVDRPEQKAANSGPTLQGTVAVWTTQTEARAPLVVTLMATDCSDGMSDRTYPLTAKVEIGGETLTGCAASSAAIEKAGESGRVE